MTGNTVQVIPCASMLGAMLLAAWLPAAAGEPVKSEEKNPLRPAQEVTAQHGMTPPEARASQGTRVTPGVATPTQVTVPELVGLGADDARARLAGLDLVMVARPPERNDAPEGSILAQEPARGASVAPGTEVVVRISAGPPPAWAWWAAGAGIGAALLLLSGAMWARRPKAAQTQPPSKPTLRVHIEAPQAVALPADAEPSAAAQREAILSPSDRPVRVEAEPVLLGASAPRAVRPGDEFTARFVAYLKAVEQEVTETLASISPRSEHRLGLKSCRWQPGTRIRVSLSGRHLTVTPPSQEFVWEGDRQLVEFDAAVAEDAPEGTVVLKFDASVNGIVVAMLRLDMDISRTKPDDRPATASGTAARTAFASYSSKDQERVLDRVAAVRISAGLDIFLDCLSLHPGEEWKPRLAEAIRERDLFLLFWSQEAARSKWVTWEWQTALAQKGTEGMQIHPLETGVMPPEQLRDLHFGDVFMLIREGQKAKPSHGPKTTARDAPALPDGLPLDPKAPEVGIRNRLVAGESGVAADQLVVDEEREKT